MTCNFFRQRVGDQLSSSLLVLDPGWMRKGNPDGPVFDEEFNVYGVGVPRGDGHDEGLVNAMNLLFGPSVSCGEVSEHGNSD
jgi:hypothetical protein